MILVAHFSEFGVSSTGLTPTAKITSVTGSTSTVITPSVPLMEIGDGFYQYDFATANAETSYVVLIDGGATLGLADRYQVAHVTAVDPDLVVVRKVIANRSRVDAGSNTLTVYDDDKTTPYQVYNLRDSGGAPTSTNVFDRNPA